MTTEPSSSSLLAELVRIFEIADAVEQVRQAQSEAVPLLVRELRHATDEAKVIYGDAWLSLVTKAARPAPRDAKITAYRPDFADACWCAKRLKERPYRTFTGAGQRAMILNARAGLNVNSGGLSARLYFSNGAAISLFEEVWRTFRDECLSLMEAGPHFAWADIDLPGPPHTTLAAHIDRLLDSHPQWMVISSHVYAPSRPTEEALHLAGSQFVHMVPMLVGVIEAALGRHPSVRAFHDLLCRYLIEEGEDDEEPGPGHISSALRYRVFERDGFRCVMCGATAATGASLEVDHIIPRARGGSNAMANLQTLCDRCNRGKSSRLSPDLRPRSMR
jgi:hypothetical protein